MYAGKTLKCTFERCSCKKTILILYNIQQYYTYTLQYSTKPYLYSSIFNKTIPILYNIQQNYTNIQQYSTKPYLYSTTFNKIQQNYTYTLGLFLQKGPYIIVAFLQQN